jgi:hypothetical protein
MTTTIIPRHRIEAAIDALIALLDASEPDSDLEPSLGWCSNWDGSVGAYGGSDERERDDDIERDAIDDLDDDGSPSLNDRPLQLGEVA